MPRIFSEIDRDAIRETLLEAGKSLFLRYGLRKTKVEELAQAAGIAKGTFYHFFQSKEDLCLAIYDREEEAMRIETAEILASHRDPVETMQALLRYSFDFIDRDSLLAHLRETGEYALLARGVGRERLAQHLDNDVQFAAALVDDLRSKGAACRSEPEVVAGVLRAVVMLTFHREEIGASVFDPVMELIAGWISRGIAEGGVGA